ncbi:MAG: hypothetical protein EOP83_05745 [Verrucomicrobiaceae bacterium]|nr:MAG: hypothetical protein EOP83_05745 [Verrucomicrobiaceae bacterium]
MASVTSITSNDQMAWAAFDFPLTISMLELANVREWLNDPSRPGSWAIDTTLNIESPTVYTRMLVLRFRIEDPDVAFEFKMRWNALIPRTPKG